VPRFAGLALLFAALLLTHAGAAAAQSKCPPIELLYDENEQLSERRRDSNADCRTDEFVYYESGKPVRAEQDGNHDGLIDSWTRFGPDGEPEHQEFDTTSDGKVDRWVELRAGSPVRQQDDRNADGKPDSTHDFEADARSRQVEDTNFDGKPDRWTTHAAGKPVESEQDRNHDGRVDLRAEFAADGAKRRELQDGNGDGKLNVSIVFENGQRGFARNGCP